MQHVTARTSTTVLMHTRVGPARRIPVELRYDSRDPFVITFAFLLSKHNVLWALGRDLVAAGLIAPTGDGDVMLHPRSEDANQVEFHFTGGQDTSMLSASLAEVADFVDRTHALVPMGHEKCWLDLDGELVKLLSSTG